MNRTAASAFLAGLVLISTHVSAGPPGGPGKKAFNALASGRRPSEPPAPVVPGPGMIKEGTRPSLEVRLGVPTFLWAGSEGRLRPGARAGGPLVPEAAARIHLARYAHLYGLGQAEAAAAKVRAVHDTGRGPVIVSFVQEVEGLPVFRDEMALALERDGDLVAISGYLAEPRMLKRGFTLTAREALAAAVSDLTDLSFAASDFRPAGKAPRDGYALYTMDPGAGAATGIVATGPLGARQAWFRLMEGLEPAWVIVLEAGRAGDVSTASYGYVISAADGRLLMRQSFTRDDAYSYRVWADPNGLSPYDGPQGTDPSPHPTGLPDGFQPPLLAPNLVTLESGPLSTGDPWLPPSATVTSGNNVDAYADITSPDGFNAGDLRASSTSASVFDRVYDVTLPPGSSSDQRQAAITQLFYTNNWLHDWFYDSGFDEPAGNAQASNLGRGGAGGDVLLAEGQDYSGTNNANMSTPPDGFSPRMQMYIFTGASGQFVEVNSPAGIAGQKLASAAQFGPANFDLTDDLVLVNDGAGAITDGCEAPVNSISGLIAVIDRGTCSFVQKVQNAEAAGAVGVIVVNNVAGAPITMGGTAIVGIPSLMISIDDGADIKANLPGVNARMFRESVVDRDGTIDNSIVAHEWGHYISNRLVGNAFGLDTQQSAGMGEGWGDFHAILMAVRPEDANVPANANWAGAFAMSGYPESAPGSNSYYWSIRRTPLSTDFAINPLTFRHIENGVALPTTAPLQFGQSGANNAEVHNTGEIWANMLWECYASLLRDTQGASPRLTFDEAQQRMKDYLVGGYKMTPNSPTFVEARDAILSVVAASDPVDLDLFWQAFAKRGLGVGAVAPDRFSTSNSGVVESFSTGGDLEVVGISLTDDVATNCLPDGELDEGEMGTLTVTIRNTGSSSLTGTTGLAASDNPALGFVPDGSLAFGTSGPFETVQSSVVAELTGVSTVQAAQVQADVDDAGLLTAGPRSASVALRLNSDEIPAASASDDVEASGTVWSPAVDANLSTPQGFERVAVAALSHRWLGPDNGSLADIYLISPPLQVSSTGSFGFNFSHRHVFEFSGVTYYDGGVIEISTDGGSSWSDIGGSAIPTYNGTITNGGGNPLELRLAYVGASQTYPAFQTVTVDLGTAYQGQTVQVRFRIGTDVFVGATGWEIDDISFTGIDNTPFPVVVDHDPTCDEDGDTFFDAQDCAPSDSQLWSAPGAVIDLAADGDASTTLSWSPPASAGGTAPPTFDLLRSDSATGFGAATCLETDTASTARVDTDTPAAIFYYLVGARNGCGRTIQPDSGGTPRGAAACP